MNKPSVLIACPNTGQIRAELCEWLLTHDHCGCAVRILPPTQIQERPISVNRRKIIDAFLESGMDWLLQIDSDMSPPSDLMKIVHYNKDMISAGTRTVKGREIIPLAMESLGGGNYRVKRGSGLFRCDAVGTGCLFTKRSVVESVQIPHVSDLVRAIDFEWCDLAREAGFEVWYDGDTPVYQYTTFAV